MANNLIQPRLIRYRDAPFYMGMDKNRFNKEVRPFITDIPIGIQGIAFDRLDLDEWIDEYKSRAGRLGDEICQKELQVLPKGETTGTSIKSSEARDFMRALEQAR